MSDTFTALHAAIIDNPADRTVRLVYADALDESGTPAGAARAEFIRAQIAIEGMADDPHRPALAARCRELFTANWIDWWRPVCAALGLPEPYVPSRKLGARVKRFVGGDKRVPGEPYIAYPDGFSVRFEHYGFTAQFYAGFPEMLAIHHFTAEILTGEIGLWFGKVPFCRMRFNGGVSEVRWEHLSGPHLGKVVELIFDRLSAAVADVLVRSPLNGLTSLKALPLESPGVVRALVHNPPWAGLRSFALSGTTPPDALRELAESCTLEHLEELTFAVREVDAPFAFAGIAGAIGGVVAGILARMAHTLPQPVGPISGPDYWPAFLALARSPVLPRLRRLRVLDADPNWVGRVAEMLMTTGEQATGRAPFLSDECVFAVADALDRDKLERLELPATRLSPACRAELTRRFGSRVVLV